MHSVLGVGPSEQLAVNNSNIIGHAILLSVLSLVPRFCIMVLQDVLKKLANVPNNQRLQ